MAILRTQTRTPLILILIICAIGTVRVVFAQNADGDENLADAVNAVDNVDNTDTAVDGADTINTAADKAPKSKSGKSGKSGKSPKTEDSSSTTSSLPTSKTPKAPKTAKAETTLKYNGLVAAGLDVNFKENKRQKGDKAEATVSKRVLKGELELSAQPVKRVRAEIGIEYNANGKTMVADSLGFRKFTEVIDPMGGTSALTDVEVELLKGLPLGPFLTVDKLYAQYNAVDNGVVRVGVMKKAFGLEERAGLDERCLLKRSIVSDGLEALGFLDHDLTAAYRHDLLNGALRLTGAFSWSAVDSSVYLQNYSAYYHVGKNLEFILSGVIRHYAADANPSTVFAASFSAKHAAAVISEAELTIGTNPQIWAAPYYRKTMLAGARLQERYPIEVNAKTLRRVVPVAEVAVYAADLDSGYVDTQIRAGVTLGFAQKSAFQFRNNVGTVIRTPKAGKSAVRRYRFDSEAVVVF